ncbi:MAG TPA: S9 family peptidase [Candidatus Bathyarchaeia archaeon]|nr:S9 family peptidase [Candidatus Bathyarchaeia archaeon]
MKRIVSCLALIAAALWGTAGAEVLTPAAFVSMTKCTDPQVSPDGKWVAFTATVPIVEKNKSNADIWIVAVAGGSPRRLTNSPGANYHARWSPDGSTIAFVSTRGGSPQIWTIPVRGGEAVRLTNISTGVSDPVWSPDGKRIAFYSSVYPDCGSDSCNAAREAKADAGRVKAKVIDALLYRHWDSWKDGKCNHLFVADAATGVCRDVTPLRNHDYPPLPFGGSSDYCFSPDGKELCVDGKEAAMEAISTNTDLFVIDLGAGAMKKITKNEAADETPRYSPDGRYIAYRAQQVPGFESDRWRLMLYDRASGETKSLTDAFDRWVTDCAWSPDSKKIYFTAGDAGYAPLWAIDVKSLKIEKLVATGNNMTPDVAADGKTIVFARAGHNFPHSIWAVSSDGKSLRRLENFNADVLAKLEMNTAENIRYKGAGGADIQAFIIKPPHFDPAKKYPAIMLVHGGPQSAFMDHWYTNWNAQVFAGAGYVIFIPNFHGSDGFGQDFVNEISRDWGGLAYDDIIKGLDYLGALSYVDSKHIGAAGASFGGYMINWIEGHTDRFACLVSMEGTYSTTSSYGATEELWFPEWEFGGTPWDRPETYAKWSPDRFAKSFKTPCLVVHNELDYRVALGEGLQMFTALQRQGVPSRLLYFPDEGHWILKPANNKFYYEQFIGWMDTYLKK